MKPGNNFYYIKDNSGNYYRIDSHNQLVVAQEIRLAAVFDYACAIKRIGGANGSKKSKFFQIESVNESEEKMVELTECESTISELTEGEQLQPIQKSVSSYDLSEIDWEEYLTHFIYIVKGLKKYGDELCKQESDIDQKICDVLHYIELCETDSDKSRELVELIRICREKRRDIKDEMTRITYFQQNFGTNANATKATHALKSIQGLKTRKYRPRKYAELFENCTWKPMDRQVQAEQPNQKVEEATYERSQGEYTQKMHENTFTEEEVAMKLCRRETPFDNQKNDWVKFAEQQAVFYQNAMQYIDNLQLDIEELDAKIEEALYNAEDANCNVVQGYMFFKYLKSLRIERKEKLQELQCMYALTDDYNCDAMAAVGEEVLAKVRDIVSVEEADMESGQEVSANAKGEPEDGHEEIAQMEEVTGVAIEQEKKQMVG